MISNNDSDSRILDFSPACLKSTGKSSPTISAKPVGVGAASQRLIPTGERSGLLTHIATAATLSSTGHRDIIAISELRRSPTTAEILRKSCTEGAAQALKKDVVFER